MHGPDCATTSVRRFAVCCAAWHHARDVRVYPRECIMSSVSAMYAVGEGPWHPAAVAHGEQGLWAPLRARVQLLVLRGDDRAALTQERLARNAHCVHLRSEDRVCMAVLGTGAHDELHPPCTSVVLVMWATGVLCALAGFVPVGPHWVCRSAESPGLAACDHCLAALCLGCLPAGH